jgi:outer membrane protein OmpA-like peptidoglycan-associated protein
MAFFKSKKTMWIIGGVLALAGVGAYIYYKSRKPKKEVEQTTEEVLKDVFDNLNFEFGKAEIKKDSYPYLDNLSDTLLKSKTWRLDIEGHTDNTGSDDFNMKLSQKRADAVKEYLVSKGISEDLITPQGYGESKPLVPNDSNANREKNRRVEFKIIKPNNEVITTIAQ